MIRPTMTAARTYRYDPFGMPTATGTLPNPFQFAGREQEAALRTLLLPREDVRSLSAGRFTSKDPSGVIDGTNLYVCAGNNLVNRPPLLRYSYFVWVGGGGGGGGPFRDHLFM